MARITLAETPSEFLLDSHGTLWQPRSIEQGGIMDAFTRKHLQAYADRIAWEDEREAFIGYVERSLADDPTLADMGWPVFYQGFVKAAAANAIASGLA